MKFTGFLPELLCNVFYRPSGKSRVFITRMMKYALYCATNTYEWERICENVFSYLLFVICCDILTHVVKKWYMLMYYRLLCNKLLCCGMRFYIVTCSYNRQLIVIFSCTVLYTLQLYNYSFNIVIYIVSFIVYMHVIVTWWNFMKQMVLLWCDYIVLL